jgi:hypothetical protein
MTEVAVDIGQAVLEAIAGFKVSVEARLTATEVRLTVLEARLAALERKPEVRALRAELPTRPAKRGYDFAATPTIDEIEALNADVNRMEAENAQLAAKIATLEQLVRELQESSPR